MKSGKPERPVKVPAPRGVKRKPKMNLVKRGSRGRPLSSGTFKAYNYRKTFVLQPIKLKDEHNTTGCRRTPPAVSTKKSPPQAQAKPVSPKKEPLQAHVIPSSGSTSTCSMFSFDFADKGAESSCALEAKKPTCTKAKKAEGNPQPQLKHRPPGKKSMYELVKDFDGQRFCMFNKDVVLQLKTIANSIVESQQISRKMPLSSPSQLKRVCFSPYDLSALEAPSISIPGSEEPALNILRILCKAIEALFKVEYLAKRETHQENIVQLCKEVKTCVKQDPSACLLLGTLDYLIDENTSVNPLLAKFETIMHSLLRYSLRRFFNSPGKKAPEGFVEPGNYLEIVPRTGSFLYNFDDLAAIVRSSIETLHALKPIVEDVVLFGKDERSIGTPSEIRICFGSFREAHKFLSKLFLTNAKTIEARQAEDPACLTLLQEVCTIARKFNVNDYKPVESLCNMQRYSRDLDALDGLVETTNELMKTLNKAKKKKRRRKKGSFEYTVFPDIVPATSTIAENAVKCPKCQKVVAEWNKGGEISCDGCKEWFHLECLGLQPNFLQQVPGDYFCPACVESRKTDAAAGAVVTDGSQK